MPEPTPASDTASGADPARGLDRWYASAREMHAMTMNRAQAGARVPDWDRRFQQRWSAELTDLWSGTVRIDDSARAPRADLENGDLVMSSRLADRFAGWPSGGTDRDQAAGDRYQIRQLLIECNRLLAPESTSLGDIRRATQRRGTAALTEAFGQAGAEHYTWEYAGHASSDAASAAHLDALRSAPSRVSAEPFVTHLPAAYTFVAGLQPADDPRDPVTWQQSVGINLIDQVNAVAPGRKAEVLADFMLHSRGLTETLSEPAQDEARTELAGIITRHFDLLPFERSDVPAENRVRAARLGQQAAAGASNLADRYAVSAAEQLRINAELGKAAITLGEAEVQAADDLVQGRPGVAERITGAVREFSGSQIDALTAREQLEIADHEYHADRYIDVVTVAEGKPFEQQARDKARAIEETFEQNQTKITLAMIGARGAYANTRTPMADAAIDGGALAKTGEERIRAGQQMLGAKVGGAFRPEALVNTPAQIPANRNWSVGSVLDGLASANTATRPQTDEEIAATDTWIVNGKRYGRDIASTERA